MYFHPLLMDSGLLIMKYSQMFRLGSMEFSLFDVADLDGVVVRVNNTFDGQGDTFFDEVVTLSAAAEKDGASGGKEGTVGVGADYLDSSNERRIVDDGAVVELSNDVDLRGLGDTVGNHEGGGPVSSLFGSVGNVEGSSGLGEVPLSSSKSRVSLLLVSRRVLEHLKGSLASRESTSKLSLGNFKLGLSLGECLLGKGEFITGLGEFVFSSPQALLGIVDLLFGIIEVLVGTFEVFSGVFQGSGSLSLLKFSLVKGSLGFLKVCLSSFESFLGLIELDLSFFKELFSLLDIGESSSLLKKSKVELVLSVVEGLVGSTNSGGSALPFGVGVGSVGGSLVGTSLSGGELDVDVVEDTLLGSKLALGRVDNGQSSEELLVSLNLLSSKSVDVVDKVDLVADGDLAELAHAGDFDLGTVKDSDGDESLSSAAFLVCRLNTDGVDAGDTESSGNASLVDITVQCVRETVEGEDGGADGVSGEEPVAEGLASVDKGVSGVVGSEDPEGFVTLDLPVVVVPGRSGPELGAGGVDDIENELLVHSPAGTVGDSDGNGPSTSLGAAAPEDTSGSVKLNEFREQFSLPLVDLLSDAEFEVEGQPGVGGGQRADYVPLFVAAVVFGEGEDHQEGQQEQLHQIYFIDLPPQIWYFQQNSAHPYTKQQLINQGRKGLISFSAKRLLEPVIVQVPLLALFTRQDIVEKMVLFVRYQDNQ